MKLRFILAGAVLAYGPTAMAHAAPQGLIVVAEDDHHKDEHAGGPPKGAPPPAKAPPHGAPPMGPHGHSVVQGQVGGPDHNPNTKGVPNRGGANTMMMSGHGTSHGNFDRRTYQRNFNATRQFHINAYVRPHGWYAHRWVFGQILPSIFWAQNYWIADYYDYDLAPPPPGFVWVRYGNDALMIDQNSGEVLQVEYGLFD